MHHTKPLDGVRTPMQTIRQNSTASRYSGAINTLAEVRVIPTGAALGAEIQGVNLALPVPDGKPVMDNGDLGSYEVVRHADNSYVQTPPAGSMLYALEVPVNGGGDTSFNNQYMAYDELPDELKRAIEGKSQVHDSSRNSAGVLRPGVRLPTKPEEVEGPAHPLVRIHSATGKRALYLGRRRVWPSNYIVGMSNTESEALLDKLWAHATQDKYKWTHHWKVGDLILWDNRCCMHYRTEVDVTQRRVMHRTTIKGEVVVAPW